MDKQTHEQAIQLFPSLHYIVSASEQKEVKPESVGKDKETFNLGVKSLKKLLPIDFSRKQVITITGPSGAFKSTIVRNFLMQGLAANNNDPEEVLLISLRDKLLFEDKKAFIKNVRLSEDVYRSDPDLRNLDSYTIEPNCPKKGWDGGSAVKYVEYTYKEKAKFYELAFISGTLLPEEFIKTIRSIFIKTKGKIRRVVLDDVSLIGVSYPFLKSSFTAGDLFLTAFVHMMRNYGVDLVISGTTDEYEEATKIVDQACLLADTVLTCNFIDVFGERVVLFKGEGLMTGSIQPGGFEAVPGVFRLSDSSDIIEKSDNDLNRIPFVIDTEYLQGLVGFDTQNIRHPELYLTLEIADAHKKYKKRIQELLDDAFPGPEVKIKSFDSREFETMHASLETLGEGPIDRTVVCAIDEFWKIEEKKESTKQTEKTHLINLMDQEDFNTADYIETLPKKNKNVSILGWPYYSNVLLLAYRKEMEEKINLSEKRLESWESLAALVKKFTPLEKGNTPINSPFDYIDFSNETKSCLFIDIINSNREFARQFGEAKNKEDPYEEENKIGKKIYEHLKEQLTENDKHILNELHAVQNIFISKYQDKIFNETIELRPDAAFYLCWYSQLRLFIKNHPELAENIRVCALPGGSIRGDWSLGIVKGSVSLNLGLKVIRQLCSETEDYNRFARGIGLPTRKSFYSEEGIIPEYFAWPRSIVKLNDIYKIYKQAIRRSSIPYYEKIRQPLSIVFGQLIPPKAMDADQSKRIKEIISRLPEQFKHFIKE
ncbi:MAG: hypothetical protein JXJ04_09040 [Spirochaetales bacterium]|nr:hypothetical protein [Spirochaetales bacterium]